ncbi:MAG: O-antigen ligase family protein [bacterium]|nr:O-antigen ligase family protein [bacterium]
MRVYKIADQLIARSFYLLFFLVPLIFTPFNFELFEFNKMLLTYAVSLIIVSGWATKSILAGRLIFRRTFLDIPLLLFLSSQLLSTIYSIDPHTSIWGYYSRSNGGLLSVVSYLLLYWAYVSNMDYKKTLSSIRYLLSSGAIVAVWGILEHFGRSPSCLILRGHFDTNCWIQDVKARVFATFGQPNWMAAWITALMPITWALALSDKQSLPLRGKRKAKSLKITMLHAVYYILPILFFAALLFTKSRSGLLGFGVACGIFWTISFLHSNKQVLRPLFLLTTSYLLLIAIFGSPWSSSIFSQRVTSNESRVAESGTALETGGTESGEIRKIVWKGALNIFRAYPIFGSGVETFAYSYYQFRPVEHNLTSEWDFLYNKAHNEYLNFLATTGVVGLGAYLLLIGAVISLFLKTGISHLSLQNPASHFTLLASLLAGYTSILVTNFFGFSVVATSTLFFLFPAMGFVLAKGNPTTYTIHDTRYTILQRLLLLFTFSFLIFNFLRLAQIWYADTLYQRATELNGGNENLSVIDAAEKAVTLRPDEPVYYNKLAKSLGGLAVSLAETGESTQAAILAESAIKAQDRAVTISPLNLNFLKARSALFFDLTSVDQKYLIDAALTLEKAVEIAPTEPKVLYNLGVLYDRLGKTREAQEVLKKALELKPNYEDAQVALGEIDKKLVK